MTRDKAIAFAEEKGLPIDVTRKSPYSIDQNLWGRAVETGFLEDIWNAPIEDVYSYTDDPAVPREPDEVVITFDQGVPVALDGRAVSPLAAVLELNARAGAQGVGRLDLVEDRLVGIKSREVYEAPGAIALITAHQELENVTVERDLARFKKGVDQRWGELVYDGLWFSPLKRALDGFVDDANANVSGDIRLTLHGGRAVVTGRRSDEALYDYAMATYDSADTFDQSLAKGFVELWGLPSKMAAQRDQRPSAPVATADRRHDVSGGDERRRHDPPLGRPLQRRAERGAEPAVGERALRLAAGALRPGCLAGARPGAARRRPARRRRAGHDALALSTTSRPRSSTAASGRPCRTRTCTPLWSAGCSSGWAPSAASCAPAGAATTRSPPTCGCSCARPPGRSPRASPSWRPR